MAGILTGDSTALSLPRILDFAAARPLWAELEERRGTPLVLDASGVERMGGLCLQILLAAAEEWRRAGVDLRVSAASQPFSEALRTLGAFESLQGPAS